MRTTIRLNPELARRAKAHAARARHSFTELIEKAVSEYLARQSKPQRPKKIVLPVSGVSGHTVTAEEIQSAIEQADLEYDLKQIRSGDRA